MRLQLGSNQFGQIRPTLPQLSTSIHQFFAEQALDELGISAELRQESRSARHEFLHPEDRFAAGNKQILRALSALIDRKTHFLDDTSQLLHLFEQNGQLRFHGLCVIEDVANASEERRQQALHYGRRRDRAQIVQHHLAFEIGLEQRLLARGRDALSAVEERSERVVSLHPRGQLAEHYASGPSAKRTLAFLRRPVARTVPPNEIFEVGERVGGFEGLDVVHDRLDELVANDVDLLHRLGELLLLSVQLVFLRVRAAAGADGENVLVFGDGDPAGLVRAQEVPAAPVVDPLSQRNLHRRR